jgi:hypothetical protein
MDPSRTRTDSTVRALLLVAVVAVVPGGRVLAQAMTTSPTIGGGVVAFGSIRARGYLWDCSATIPRATIRIPPR